MSGLWKWIGISVGALIVAIVLFLGFFDWNLLRGPIARRVSARIDRPVSIGHLHLVLLSLHPRVEIRGLEVGNPRWAGGGQMADVQGVRIEAELLPLLKGDLVLSTVEIVKPNLYLFRSAADRANWRLGSAQGRPAPPQKRSSATSFPVVHQMYIESGRLRMIDQVRKLDFTGSFGAQGGSAGSRGTQPFLMAGNGQLNARPFTLKVSGGPLIWAETHKPYPFDVSIIASDIHASARGMLPNPFDLGHLDVTLSASGDDLADLYYLTGLALPNSPPYQFSGRLKRIGTRFDFSNIAGRLGKSDIEGTVSVQVQGDRPRLTAALESRTLDLVDLAPVFGAPSRPAPAPSRWLFPRAPLQLNRIRGMDAALHYRAESVEAPKLPLRRVDVRLRLDHGVLDIAPFSFTLPLGELAGDARLDATGEVPSTHIDVRLRNVHLGQFRPAGSQSPLEGVLVGRLDVRGRGDSIHDVASTANGTLSVVIPHGEVDQAFAELAGIDIVRGLGLLLTHKNKQVAVRCGIADFDARNGELKVQQVVFDTKTVLITGKGSIDLGQERLDLSIYGHPKKFRIVRLKTPIEISGTLLHPSIGLKPGNALTQGAVAAVLGTLATPFAAIAAFIDPGLAKNADCQALLNDAKRAGAPLETAAARARTRK